MNYKRSAKIVMALQPFEFFDVFKKRYIRAGSDNQLYGNKFFYEVTNYGLGLLLYPTVVSKELATHHCGSGSLPGLM